MPAPTVEEARASIVEHLGDHYAFYGEELGVRIARKHLHWYTDELSGASEFRQQINAAGSVAEQYATVERFFVRLAAQGERLRYAGRRRDAGGRRENLRCATHGCTPCEVRVTEALAA